MQKDQEFDPTDKKALVKSILKMQRMVDKPIKTTVPANRPDLKQFWQTKKDWQTIGEVVVDEIKGTLDNEGFVSKTLQNRSTKKPQYNHYPEQYDFFQATVKVTEKELAKTPWEMLDRKYHTGLAQIIKPEERAWYSAVKQTPNKLNFKKFNIVMLEEMLVELKKLNLPPSCLCISFDVFQDLSEDINLVSYFEPWCTHMLLLEGCFGKILGVDIYTDGFRPRKLRTLPPGTAIAFSAPQYVGEYAREWQKTETLVDKQEKSKTWETGLAEIMFISNPKAVCLATRTK